jgi:hypothetical protein
MNRKINAKDLIDSESEILKRIANEVFESEIREVVAGHSSCTTGHRSGSTHSSHSSAIKERLVSGDTE